MRLFIRETAPAPRHWERFLRPGSINVKWRPPRGAVDTGVFECEASGSPVREPGLLIVHPDPGERVLAAMGAAGERMRLCVVTVAGIDREYSAVHQLVYRREAALRDEADLALFAAAVERFLFEYNRTGSPDFRLLEPDDVPESLLAVQAFLNALGTVSDVQRERLVELWSAQPEEQRNVLWLAAEGEYRLRARGAAGEWELAGLPGRFPSGEASRADPAWCAIDYNACANLIRRALLGSAPSTTVAPNGGDLATTKREGA